ncbi:hypothetical protein SAMN05444851_1731 [Aliiroseovarius sediminilitoris]|uniref:Uncharacterized protein n=1 Tax=Aliiroseovarius sediminilitoris TaxID=1173584 RepID=A0A1I0PLZ7_9RHOB|nr:hypothetical protein [Aliiroseovarius sediminilitoris]SEW15255.1 hypothetical protein SAMN05444851_1731 [Aliiroseovarius sediminilitoris]
MPKITTNDNARATERPSRDIGVPAFMSRMTCACAETLTRANAPLAQAVFHHVEVLKQPPTDAARALGIEPGDAAYLLTGLREDVAKDLVLLLDAKRQSEETSGKKEISDE